MKLNKNYIMRRVGKGRRKHIFYQGDLFYSLCGMGSAGSGYPALPLEETGG